MPVNDFEKQLQQKMDELQLRPSGEVWEEVEMRIRKEKKRRRVIFWFSSLGIMLALGTAWWMIPGNQERLAIKNNTEQAASGTPVNKVSTGEQGTQIPINNSSEQDKEQEKEVDITNATPGDQQPVINKKATDDKTTAIISSNANPSSDAEIEINSHPGAVARRKGKQVESKDDLLISAQNASKGQRQSPVSSTPDPITQKDNNLDKPAGKPDVIVTAPPVVLIEEPVKKMETTDQVITSAKTTDNVKDSTLLTEPTTAPKKKAGKNNKNKWEFGASVFAGSSIITNSIAIGDQRKSMDYVYSAPGSISNQFFANSPVARPSSGTVSPPSNGFAWQLGAYAKRKLSAKTGFSLGLDFSSYSTSQETGSKVDSNLVISNNSYVSRVSDVYRSGTASSHTNHYYYLGLPISFHWQLNKSDKNPLIWKNGFSFGILTGSNAVVYSAAANVYYEDKKLVNNVQFAYQTGLYFKLMNRNPHPLSLGLLYNYNFSKLEKTDESVKNNLSSFGLQLGWIIKK